MKYRIVESKYADGRSYFQVQSKGFIFWCDDGVEYHTLKGAQDYVSRMKLVDTIVHT